MTLTLLQMNSFEFDERASYNKFDITGKLGINCVIECVKRKLKRRFTDLKHHVLFVRGRTGSGKSSCMPTQLFKYLDTNKTSLYEGNKIRKTGIVVNVVEPRVLLCSSLAESNLEFEPYLKLGFNTGYRTGAGSVDATHSSKLVYMTTDIFRMMLNGNKNLGDIVIVDECHILEIPMIILFHEIKKYLHSSVNYENMPIFIFASATINLDLVVPYIFDNKNLTDIYMDGLMINHIAGSRNFSVDNYFLTDKQEQDFKNPNNFIKWLLTDRVEVSINSPSKTKHGIPVRDMLIFSYGVGFFKLFNPKSMSFCRYPIFKSSIDYDDSDEVIKWRKKNINKTRVLILPYSTTCKGFASTVLRDIIDHDVECQKNEIKIFLSTPVIETGKTFDTWYQVFDTGLQNCNIINPLIYFPNQRTLRKSTIDQAASIQRCGRAGRKAIGISYRLFTERVWNEMMPNPLPNNISTVSNVLTIISCKKITDKYIDTVKDNDYIFSNSFDTNLITSQDLTNSGYTTPWGEYIGDIRNPNEPCQKWVLVAEYLYYLHNTNLLKILIDCRFTRNKMSNFAANSDSFKVEDFGPELQEFNKDRVSAILEARQEYIKFLIGGSKIFKKLK
jgi:hypothetical protein